MAQPSSVPSLAGAHTLQDVNRIFNSLEAFLKVQQYALVIPYGAAPIDPVDGQVWATAAGLFVQINGATTGPL